MQARARLGHDLVARSDLAHEHLSGVHLQGDLAHGAGDRARIARRADDHRPPAEGHLGHGQVHRRLGRVAVTEALRFLHDADNQVRDPLVRKAPVGHDPSSDRVLARPVAPRHRLVDDDNWLGVRYVGIGQPAAANERRGHRFKEVRRDDVQFAPPPPSALKESG